jgi:acyl dehydratase
MPSYRPIAELESLVGESRQTIEGLRIEAGKVAEYADALRIDDPVFTDPEVAAERGFDAIPATPIHTMTALADHYQVDGGPLYAFDLGMSVERKVLGEQSYEYDRLPVVGDVLDGETTLADVRTKKDGEMTFATLETTFTDQDGDRVLVESRTMIEIGQVEGE